jgi:hypothetical protein
LRLFKGLKAVEAGSDEESESEEEEDLEEQDNGKDSGYVSSGQISSGEDTFRKVNRSQTTAGYDSDDDSDDGSEYDHDSEGEKIPAGDFESGDEDVLEGQYWRACCSHI